MARRGTTIRRERFLPHRYERFGLEFEPKICELDGGRKVSSFNVARHLVDLSEYRFSTVQLVCDLYAPPELIERVFPEAERRQPPARLIVCVRCPQTRFRASSEVNTKNLAGNGHVLATIDLQRAEVAGSVELVPYLVRASPASYDAASGGYGGVSGLRLASSRSWEVRVDRPRPAGGASLDIRYASFRDLGSLQFRWPESVYKLECQSESPILWLNLDNERVCEALNSSANVGIRARLRDVFFDTISQAVWTRLFLKSAHDLRDSDEPPFEWEQSVLEEFLPTLYPDEVTHAARVTALRTELEQGDESLLLDRLDPLLQARLDLTGHMTKLVEAGE